jgi:hypothetical protein
MVNDDNITHALRALMAIGSFAAPTDGTCAGWHGRAMGGHEFDPIID